MLSWKENTHMLPNTRNRVPESTADIIIEEIKAEMEERVRYYARHPRKIAQRLRELDEEWDIERAIEANAAAFGFSGIVLGATVDRRWLFLPALVTAFLFQHAIQGWCPPVPVLRRLGFRTAHEIEHERNALKVLRGDYTDIGKAVDKAAAALEAAA
jgi:hypothetical protein